MRFPTTMEQKDQRLHGGGVPSMEGAVRASTSDPQPLDGTSQERTQLQTSWRLENGRDQLTLSAPAVKKGSAQGEHLLKRPPQEKRIFVAQD